MRRMPKHGRHSIPWRHSTGRMAHIDHQILILFYYLHIPINSPKILPLICTLISPVNLYIFGMWEEIHMVTKRMYKPHTESNQRSRLSLNTGGEIAVLLAAPLGPHIIWISMRLSMLVTIAKMQII